jgi:hypothetical protein
MKAALLLAEARRVGACFAANGGRLVVEAPAPLPDDLVAALREHKRELLALLMVASEPDHDRVTECWQERAAIVEYDGGLPRDEAERQAQVHALAHFGLPTSYRFH